MASKMVANIFIPPKYYDERFLNGFLSYWTYSEWQKKRYQDLMSKMDENWVIPKMVAIGREYRPKKCL